MAIAEPPTSSMLATAGSANARDGHGGVGSAATSLLLAPGAGPPLVTSPNMGSTSVNLPLLARTTARIKDEAIGNVFFDVSNANFSINLTGDLNGDGVVNCDDLAVAGASIGKRTGQAGTVCRPPRNNLGGPFVPARRCRCGKQMRCRRLHG